jgi:hypothetical protein
MENQLLELRDLAVEAGNPAHLVLTATVRAVYERVLRSKYADQLPPRRVFEWCERSRLGDALATARAIDTAVTR